MVSKILCAAVLGIDAYIVEVEAHLESQVPRGGEKLHPFMLPAFHSDNIGRQEWAFF